MEILGMDQGWVGNECGPDWRIGHGYDTLQGSSLDVIDLMGNPETDLEIEIID